jgi:hypothetical protein
MNTQTTAYIGHDEKLAGELQSLNDVLILDTEILNIIGGGEGMVSIG